MNEKKYICVELVLTVLILTNDVCWYKIFFYMLLYIQYIQDFTIKKLNIKIIQIEYDKKILTNCYKMH